MAEKPELQVADLSSGLTRADFHRMVERMLGKPPTDQEMAEIAAEYPDLFAAAPVDQTHGGTDGDHGQGK